MQYILNKIVNRRREIDGVQMGVVCLSVLSCLNRLTYDVHNQLGLLVVLVWMGSCKVSYRGTGSARTIRHKYDHLVCSCRLILILARLGL